MDEKTLDLLRDARDEIEASVRSAIGRHQSRVLPPRHLWAGNGASDQDRYQHTLDTFFTNERDLLARLEEAIGAAEGPDVALAA